MKRLIVLAVGAMLALSACGSESLEPASTPTPTVEATATPAQFASIIAEHEGSWQDYADNMVDCALARVLGDGPLDEIKVTTCSLSASTVTLEARTALKAIDALPTPDAEMSALVERTVKVLTPLSQIEASEACAESTSEACGDMEAIVNAAIRPLVPVLDAWSPYLN